MTIKVAEIRHIQDNTSTQRFGRSFPVSSCLTEERVMQMAWYIVGKLSELPMADQDPTYVFKILKEALEMPEEKIEEILLDWWPEEFGQNNLTKEEDQ